MPLSLLLASFALLLPTPAQETLELSPWMGDHMVAPADVPWRVRGRCAAGAAVSATLWTRVDGRSTSFAQGATADEAGGFEIVFPPQAAGLSSELTVTVGAQRRVLRDVAFGDLWIGSGQSNMEWTSRQLGQEPADLRGAEDAGVRLFRVEPATATEPAERLAGTWLRNSPEAAASFSAVGFHFARELRQRTGRPIGLLLSAWGGTPAEAWTPRAALEGDERFAPILARTSDAPQWAASALYNAMIHPLLGCQPRGVIWYQGESNADRAEQYAPLFQALIGSWRAAFQAPELPFLFVQLANFRARAPAPGESAWAELREAQAAALELPATGMAVAIDVGEADDIHPRDKATVALRLALEAQRVAYGRELDSRGPRYAGHQVEGAQVRVHFDFAEGLRTRTGDAPAGFALAGEDRVFHWAQARIDGESVVLSSAAVPAPAAVRFAWADNPAHDLVNGAGLPAEPFRTDTWPGVTAGVR
jgi:sialate O-acetylesterase